MILWFCDFVGLWVGYFLVNEVVSRWVDEVESWRVMYSGTLGFREFKGKRVALFCTSYIKECLCCVAPQGTHTSQFTETRKVETTSLTPQSKHSTLGVGNNDVCKPSQPFCLINIILTAFHCAKQRLNTKRLRLRHWKKHKTLPCYEIKLLPLPFELWGNRHT